MFLLLPYRDDNPTRKFALINWCLIAANLWVFFAYQFPLTEKQQLAITRHSDSFRQVSLPNSPLLNQLLRRGNGPPL